MQLKEKAKQLKTDIPAVFLCLNKKETPLGAKLVAGITICYALSPIDLIPDFIPVLGYLDDVIILPALIALTIHLLPADTFEQCRKESEHMWKNGRPKKWYYALPFIGIWLLVIWLFLKFVFF
ncbi:MAG: YkvA family protein [Oscillospiraceae bacterium]|nr:YkvA family protein [Oscillospiraceae bacterium]